MNGAGPGRLERSLVVLLAFAGYCVGYACTYASTSTTFILPLTREFGWGRIVPSLMYVGAMFGVVVASVFLGRIMERIGAATTAAVSGILLALVMFAMSAMSGSQGVAIGLAFLAGSLGAGTGTGLYVTILPRFFDTRLGLALGLAVLGQSAGSVIMPPLSAGITAREGWRAAFLWLGTIELVGTLIVALLLGWLVSHRQASGGGRHVGAEGVSPEHAIRQRPFWLLGGALFLQALGMFGVSFHMFPIYSDLGVGWESLPQVTIALGIGLAAGRLISGLLLDRFEPRLVAMGMFATGALAVAWLATLTSAAHWSSLYLPALLIGAAMGSETDILAYTARRLFGLAHYPVIYNRLLIAFFLGAMTGPLVLGWSFDHLSAPRLGLWLLAASCTAAAAIALCLPRIGNFKQESSSARTKAVPGRI